MGTRSTGVQGRVRELIVNVFGKILVEELDYVHRQEARNATKIAANE